MPRINASSAHNKQRHYNVTVLALEARSSNAVAKAGGLIFCLLEPRLKLLLGKYLMWVVTQTSVLEGNLA